MNNNLLILGAGQYGAVASEIADSMGCFDRIDFLDDNAPEHAVGFFNDCQYLLTFFRQKILKTTKILERGHHHVQKNPETLS